MFTLYLLVTNHPHLTTRTHAFVLCIQILLPTVLHPMILNLFEYKLKMFTLTGKVLEIWNKKKLTYGFTPNT